MKKMITILLFLYGICIGLPDIAVAVYNTRLRLDDGIMMILILCIFISGLYHPYSFTKSQLKFLKMIFLFAGFCVISLSISLIAGLPFEPHSFLRMLGCMPILVTLPLVLRSSKTIKYFGLGLMSGGLIFLSQLLFIYYEVLQVNQFKYYYKLKNKVSFETWNSNTPGVFALMFTVALLLIGSEMRGIKKKIFWTTAAFISLVPFLLYSRGAMAAVIFSWFVFILLARKNYCFKIFVVLLLAGTLISQAVLQKNLLVSATSIDLKTGKGLSEHHIMWRTALELAADSPLYGYGFGQEIRSYKMRMGKGMAHNAFLSVLVEGGLIGLLLFIWPLGYLARRLWAFSHGRLYDIRAVISLSFFLGIIIQSFSRSELYWQKSSMLILSLLLISLGGIEDSLPSEVITENTDLKTDKP